MDPEVLVKVLAALVAIGSFLVGLDTPNGRAATTSSVLDVRQALEVDARPRYPGAVRLAQFGKCKLFGKVMVARQKATDSGNASASVRAEKGRPQHRGAATNPPPRSAR